MNKYKIKNDIDLNVLKKYPFEYEDSSKFAHGNKDASKFIKIWKHNRKIEFTNGTYPHGLKILNMLTRDNLVEKIDDK